MSALDDLLSNALKLNAYGADAQATGQMMSGLSHLQYGIQANQAAEYEAAQLRQNAGQAMAASERQAFDVDRQAQYITSNAIATAAASGGGASDPTVVNLIARNAGEMAYRKAVTLYNGEDRSRALNMQADAREYAGKNAQANSLMVAGSQFFNAGTTVLKGAAKDASLRSRFGGDGPDLGE